jgi:hypothetical protein
VYNAFRTQLEQGKEFREIYQTFGLKTLLVGESLTMVLVVQQFLKPVLDTRRQVKPRQIVRDLHADIDRLGHNDLAK